MQKNSGRAVASLVLGIIAVFFSWWGVISLISVVCGIIGIILAIEAKKEIEGTDQPKGIATAGFVLNIVGLAIGAIFFFACVACVGAMANFSTLWSWC